MTSQRPRPDFVARTLRGCAWVIATCVLGALGGRDALAQDRPAPASEAEPSRVDDVPPSPDVSDEAPSDEAPSDAIPSQSQSSRAPADKDAARLASKPSRAQSAKPELDPSIANFPAVLPNGADKTGVSSQAISVPQGAGKIEGMGESFSAQLSTGIATYSIPIALPGARGGADPSLSLSYSSGSGAGTAGMGWTLPIPFIARQTDRGLPRFADSAAWTPAQDRFVFNGGQELVPICTVGADLSCAGAIAAPVAEAMPSWSAGWQYFRPRVEGGFLRFFWSQDKKTWRVQDKSGSMLELGVSPYEPGYTAALESDPGDASKIFRWNLVRQYDQHVDAAGLPVNVVAYRYETVDGLAYPTDVLYTPPATNAGTAPLSSWAHHVRLRWQARSDAPWSYRRGWPTRLAQRLAGVDVASKPFGTEAPATPRELVRRYHLGYDAGSHTSLLTSVEVEGRCAGSVTEPLPAVTGCPKLPALTLGYQHVAPFDTQGNPSVADLAGYEGFDERITTMAASPSFSLDEDQTDLFDLDANGLPDVLVTKPGNFGGKHGVFWNGDGGNEDKFGSGTIGVLGVNGADANTIKLSNLNVRAQDLDGDATIDLLHMPAVKTYAVYTPKKMGLDWQWVGRAITTASQQAPQIDLGGDAPDIHILDVDGDGLVDVVRTTGTQVQTFFALGRYPGGDGQLGHATWTSATTAAISNAPVTACVPWAGLPIQFSNSETKLADMNGDGLTDIVRVLPGQIRYWPGRGNGLWGTGSSDLDGCPAGTFGAGRDVAMTDSPNYSGINGDTLRLDDVNGDGLTDLVQVRFDAVDVWLNVDGLGWTERHIVDGTPPSPSFANRVRLVDINGSGTRDVLWGSSGAYKYIDLSGGKRPWVLTKVDNGLGKTTELEYATSTEQMLAAAKAGSPWTTFTPSPVHVVAKTTERDHLGAVNLPDGAYVTEYVYRNGFFDGLQREFRGFREVSVTRAGDANSPTSTESSRFLLGECAVDCTPADAWKDNPREALKGIGVVAEARDPATGTYLSTTHHTVTLRKLYAGLDGRGVFHAFVSATDSFAYDTFGFVASASTASLPEVVDESTATTLQVDVPLRSTAGRAHTRTSSLVDVFGNATEQIAEGCVDGSGCVDGPDEVITSHTEPARPAGDTTGWLWRTVHTFVTGSAHPGQERSSTFVTFDSLGRPTETFAELVGTLPLDRFHESLGASVAPDPPTQSTDGLIAVSDVTYDGFGNVIASHGAGSRCRTVVFDTAFVELPVTETVFVGQVGQDDCGTQPLSTSADYEPVLRLVAEVTDLHGEKTLADYDGFGRPTALWRPSPTEVGEVGPIPSVLIEYQLGNPVSRIHTQTQDGASAADGAYQQAWAYVDGLGRTIVALGEADPSALDAGEWIVGGRSTYDAKGAVERTYQPWFSSGDPAAFPLGTPPPTDYARARYDAFGRTIETYGLDGALVLQTHYHALAKDLYDAADKGPGPHHDTYASERVDGHGRAVDVIERAHTDPQTIEERHTKTKYLPTGEVEAVTRVRGAGLESVTRWLRYDSLGRRVLNVEPHTTVGFDPSPTTDPDTMHAWRYAYDDAGELVGTSDARGCGANYAYDAGGRLVFEDYSPCLAAHAAYSAPDPVDRYDGVEVRYQYDTADPDAPAGFFDGPHAALLLGRLVAVRDRTAHTVTRFDGRGRVTGVARRLVPPGTVSPSAEDRYAGRWYTRFARFDAADRPVRESTGAEATDLLGSELSDDGELSAAARKSSIETTYSARGTVKQVAGSYGLLVDHVARAADGLVDEIQYGDLAATKTGFTYDQRRRLLSVQTYRGPPSAWTSPPPSYLPAPTYPGAPATFQLLLADEDFAYDEVDNPTEIRDWRLPDEWPAGAKPVHKTATYDDLYRLESITYEHTGGGGIDAWTSPFESENSGNTDPRRAKPSPHVSFDKRVVQQTYAYDWLGNLAHSDDDAHGFYDRSLGTQTHATAAGKPYQLTAAQNDAPPPAQSATRVGHLSAVYDPTGNLSSMAVHRAGPCLPAGAQCDQRFAYDWDEVGRLVRARRWDVASAGAASDPLPAGNPAVELGYAYDANDQRVIKTALDPATGDEAHTLYVFETLELRRAAWDAQAGDYARTATSEVPYLLAHGVRLGRVVYEEPADGVPEIAGGLLGPHTHVFFELGDHLGSNSVVLDKATGELVERSTLQADGGADSDYRPARWDGFREDYRFTGKEEDVEVGLVYFGARFLAPALGRWASADPLAVHGLGADANLYAYVHGAVLRAVDPRGLDGENDTAQESFADGTAPYSTSGTLSTDVPDRAEPIAPPTGAADQTWRHHTARSFATGVARGAVVGLWRAQYGPGPVLNLVTGGALGMAEAGEHIANAAMSGGGVEPVLDAVNETLNPFYATAVSAIELDKAIEQRDPDAIGKSTVDTAVSGTAAIVTVVGAVEGLAGDAPAVGGNRMGAAPASVVGDVGAVEVTISESKSPQAVAHLEKTGSFDKPLEIDRAGRGARRRENVKKLSTKKNFDRDEAPPAVFKESKGANVEHISASDNRSAGGQLGGQIRKLPDGTKVILRRGR